MDNVVLSPHCASARWETSRKMAERSIENVVEFLRGKRSHVVPEQWDLEF
jgi:phosphoglycerate dehydrogenase-like enzyme